MMRIGTQCGEVRHSSLILQALTLVALAGALQRGAGCAADGQSAGDLRPPTEPAVENLAELSLEDLTAVKVNTVFGASKREQSTAQAPSAVSIVTQDDIEKSRTRPRPTGFCSTTRATRPTTTRRLWT